MPGQSNPYEPPATPLGSPAGPVVRRSRWLPLRWIPTAFLVASAAGSLSLAAVVVAAEVRRAVTGRAGTAPPSPGFKAAIIASLLAYGALSFAAARAWQACRWKRAVALTILWDTVGATAAASIGPPRGSSPSLDPGGPPASTPDRIRHEHRRTPQAIRPPGCPASLV